MVDSCFFKAFEDCVQDVEKLNMCVPFLEEATDLLEMANEYTTCRIALVNNLPGLGVWGLKFEPCVSTREQIEIRFARCTRCCFVAGRVIGPVQLAHAEHSRVTYMFVHMLRANELFELLTCELTSR